MTNSFFTTINPSNGVKIQDYPIFSADELLARLEFVSVVQKSWSNTSVSTRSSLLESLAKVLRKQAQPLSVLMSTEMGKPVKFALTEIEKAAMSCEFYAKEGPGFLEPRQIATKYQKSYVSYRPLGSVLAIMPWNYPLWQVLRFAIPCLLAGNSIILKHAPNVTGCGLMIEKLILEAGFPAGVFQTVVIADAMAADIIAHPAIAAVTVTGSPLAGRAVGQLAAESLKKIVLELGGNDPYVILEDADLTKAADDIVFSRMNNSGQVCVAAKRIIAVDSIYDELKALLLERLSTLTFGEPLNPNTQFGPLAREDLRAHLAEQVSKSIAQGAQCLLGGELPTGPGYYYPATLLSEVKPGMVAFDEELFGPVVTLIRALSEQEAIELANNTPYGLGAAVFTANLEKGEKIARDQLDAGSCFVNSYVASSPLMPFGGIKQSGFGRELSLEGIREFTNIKTVVVA